MSSEALNLFEEAAVVKDIEQLEWVDYKPVAPIQSNNVIEFIISPSQMKYLDLKKCQLQVKLRMTKADGTVVTISEMGSSAVTPVNLSLHSIFSQCDVSLQQKILTPTVNGNYPYKAMIDVLVDEATPENIDTYLRPEGFINRVAAQTLPNDTLFNYFGKLFANGAEVCLQGKIRMDICSIDKLIPNNIEVRFRFFQSSDNFRILTNSADETFKLELVDATLKACHVRLPNEELIRQTELFAKSPAVYDFRRSDIKCYQIAQGSFSAQFENVYNNNLPSEIILAFIDSSAYSGDFQKDPFDFKHCSIKHLEVSIDGVNILAPPLKPNFPTKDYTEAYLRLQKDGQSLGISYDKFGQGYALFRFDFERHIPKPLKGVSKKGYIRVTVNFGVPLPTGMTLLMYGVCQDRFLIDSARNVIQG